MSRHTAAVLATLVAVLAHPSGALAQSPFIQSIVPSETSQILTIRGVNFGTAPPQVYLNFTALAVQSSSPTLIVAALPPPPPLAPGSYPLLLVVGTQFAVAEVTLGGVGAFTLPSTGTANVAFGFPSMPLTMIGSSFNAVSQQPERQTFRWRVDPVGNATMIPGGRLNLLFGVNSNTPALTGLGINDNGTIDFAPAQVFPGVVTSVTAGAGLVTSGTPEDVTLSVSGITGGMIANSAIGSVHIGNGQISLPHLAFDPATQPELETHKVSADHDTRYYTKSQADSLFHPKRTTLGYQVPASLSPPTSSFVPMMTVGAFTKDRVTSSILLMWNGSVHNINFPLANNFCEYQLRIDGLAEPDNAGRVYSRLPDSSVGATALFTNLGAGVHGVSIWGRGDAAQCWINIFVRPETVIVEESGR
jgi:hypothetical protein